jgi:ubiquinone/menaquinone biosynthesis C-methylase UbiE
MKEAIESHWSNTSSAYNRWALNNFHSSPVRRVWRELYSRLLPEPSLEVLDVGTGPGIMGFFLAELGHRVTGVDVSAGMLEEARRNANKLRLAIEFEKADGETLPFRDSTFDVVTNRLVLWTLPHPEHALNEWTRVLRPGGRLIIIDGCQAQIRQTLWHKLWKLSSVPIVVATEGRNPLKGRQPMEIWRKLPLTFERRPDWEVARLRRLGYRDVAVERIPRIALGVAEFLKHGCWGDYNVVSGIRR